MPPTNPLNESEQLKEASHLANGDRPQTTDQPPLPEDSAMAKAEKVEWHGDEPHDAPNGKRKREEEDLSDPQPRKRGVASIRPEYLLQTSSNAGGDERPTDSRDRRDQNRKKQKGQNTNRRFGSSRDTLQLCMSRTTQPEFSPKECQYGDNCKFTHDLRKYLREGKREDLTTFGKCPVWEARGKCAAGWKCRFAGSHSEESSLDDGRKELILTQDATRSMPNGADADGEEGSEVVNVATPQDRINLGKRKLATSKADEYNNFLSKITQHEDKSKNHERNKASNDVPGPETKPKEDTAPEDQNKEAENEGKQQNGVGSDMPHDQKKSELDERASYVEPKFLPSEKRRLYFGPETPVLAPLTTQGNLPFRRLCVGLGAQVTWSEMAMSLPIIQGQKSEWALMKAHQSELQSPRFTPSSNSTVIKGYDNGRDIKFGTQIAANKPWQALKATEIITTLCPQLRAIDLNCGCPIDLVYRQGAGSALMDSPAKLEKILRGMNAVSGEVPVQCKIRMGTKDSKPTADRLVERLAFGGPEASQLGLGPPGVAAVTLHGRSRQQRYTKMADWSYIAECASLIQGYNEELHARTDTAQEPDARVVNASRRMYFIGNGDCYSHVDYFDHIAHAKVDSVMIARGALIKPWIFEEIERGQYLDKSSIERLGYIEQFVRYGLETWGSDEIGVGITRRFLLEWLSFACRYVPIGLLEHLPPGLNDRPPAYRGRDELETLMASDNVKDWIKISEMFLGPAHQDFRFDPKHKSNSYDTGGDYTAEG